MDFGGGRLVEGLGGKIGVGCLMIMLGEKKCNNFWMKSIPNHNIDQLCSRVKCVSLTVVPDYVDQQASPSSVSITACYTSITTYHGNFLLSGPPRLSSTVVIHHHHHHEHHHHHYPKHHQVSVTSLLTSLSLAHLAPRLLLNGFDTVPRLQNLSTEDLDFLEVDSGP